MTITNRGTYSIVSSDGGAETGTITVTNTTISTISSTTAATNCFAGGMLDNVTYTLSSDGRTLTLPNCPYSWSSIYDITTPSSAPTMKPTGYWNFSD